MIEHLLLLAVVLFFVGLGLICVVLADVVVLLVVLWLLMYVDVTVDGAA